ncbi:MAG: DNA polymerase IV [Armatimonadetes bacterium]|nr:DNA polymerase IV [Armatimonadota bacterium]
MKARAILHIDMDAFFAAIEQLRRPELRGKPVVVGGDGNPRSRAVVSTASYEARVFGIRSAMPMREALRLCPQAIFLPVDFAAYEAVSARLMALLREITPLVQPVSLDEAFLDATECAAAAEEIARTLKARIRGDLGLTASVGVAPNKLLAKIASDMHKPDGLTIITAERAAEMLAPLPVSRLWGVGPKAEARLREIGITTIGDLARVPEERLVETFGGAWGRMLAEHARGIDDSPVETHREPKSMSRETTFERDIQDQETLRGVLREMSDDLAGWLRESGYGARTVTVKVRFGDFTTVTRSLTMPEAVDDAPAIFEIAGRLMARVEWSEAAWVSAVERSTLHKSGTSPGAASVTAAERRTLHRSGTSLEAESVSAVERQALHQRGTSPGAEPASAATRNTLQGVARASEAESVIAVERHASHRGRTRRVRLVGLRVAGLIASGTAPSRPGGPAGAGNRPEQTSLFPTSSPADEP